MIASLNYDLFRIHHFLAFCYLASAVVRCIHCPLGRPRGLVHGAPVPAFGNGALVCSKVGEAGSIVCIHRLHGIMKNVASNRRSESLTIVGRRAEMDARKDSSILYFPECS
jgi:hypothetical protein